jgi:HAD superfamily hydrolase (TIGR01549 family)
MADTAIFDVDGTLVDTNYQHALAWYRAFRRYDLTFPIWRIHRSVGMGGDQLVPEIAGQDVDDRLGEQLQDAWAEEFDVMIDEIQPFDTARELLQDVKDRGFRVVLASSGKKKHVEHFLELIGGKDIADAWTTSDDVEASKPEPDLVATALEKVSGASGVMIGDSTWDAVAAGKLGVPTLAVRTGGFSPEELTAAGALKVFESLAALRDGLDDTPLNRPSS